MNRRSFLKALPAIPALALAPPIAEGQAAIREGKLVLYVPEHTSAKVFSAAREALAKFQSGEEKSLVLPDSCTLYRAD